MFRRFMNKLFLSCLKATELLEKKIHVHLSTREKYQLKAHKMMCDACRRYEKQNLFIENHLNYQKPISAKEVDVDELKRLINNKLQN
jgi:hypothetical protein